MVSGSHHKRLWCNGYHYCLPSNRPGFDSRRTHKSAISSFLDFFERVFHGIAVASCAKCGAEAYDMRIESNR
ncbi:hypothetical protein TWF751_003332 [Orbilia oligospora]|nr:hypothetical protein TWF751_003332 [Orbilia oligospora]